MDTHIQFRIDEETRRLAQQMAESQGRTLSGACRELVEQLAEQQRQATSYHNGLSLQVQRAFDKLEAGAATFVDHDTAKSRMEERKSRLRARHLSRSHR
ncbi:damage-inducible protein J [Halomonas denitrificans]|nr:MULTISPECIES: damage-inducible protein J [Halomonas]MBY6030951.1 damage-inducible protein J [Halomonas sp. DP8Y7-1]MCA0973107.1 damage-inducible protein J [Halomonas denitrificans]